MTTKHDSFDASGHGFFVRSAHGMRNSTDRVLVWIEGGSPDQVVGFPQAYRDNVYGSMGIEVDSKDTFVGLSAYSLVLALFTGSRIPVRPPWFDDLPTFTGHLVIGELGSESTDFPQRNRAARMAIINPLEPITGLRFGSLLGSINDEWRLWPPITHSLTEGMTLGLTTHDSRDQVVGGTALFGGDWVAVNGRYLYIGDWSAAGPFSPPGDRRPPIPDNLLPRIFEDSKQFHRNLVEKWI